MATTNSIPFAISAWHIVGFMFLITATACTCVFGSPQLTLVIVGLLSTGILQIISPIVAAASAYQGDSTQSISMAILLMGIVGLQPVNWAQATYSPQHALITNNSTDLCIWINTGCNKTLLKKVALIYCNTMLVASATTQTQEIVCKDINNFIKYDHHYSRLVDETMLDVQTKQYVTVTVVSSIHAR